MITRPLSSQRGMSMIEVMVTIAILAVLLGVGVPNLSSWMRNTEIKTTAQSLMTGLQLARGEAVRRNAPVSFTLTGTAWSVGCQTPSTVAPICEATIQSSPAEEGGKNTSLTVTPAGKTSVVFSAFGQAVAGGITQLDVFMSNDARATPLRILFNGGSARLCNPAFKAASNSQGC